MIGADRFPGRIMGRNAVGGLKQPVKYAERPYRETLDSKRRGRSPILQAPTPEFLNSWRARKKGKTGQIVWVTAMLGYIVNIMQLSFMIAHDVHFTLV